MRKQRCFTIIQSRTVRLTLTIAVAVYLMMLSSIPSFAQNSTTKATSLFNGHDLTGWKVVNPAHENLWVVKDSTIICGDLIQSIPSNTYLQTENEYENFEFRCLFRLSGDPLTGMINSGIQYRSKIVDGRMIGYQADIGDGYWGDLYDEHRRGTLVKGNLETLHHLFNKDGWNSYIIRVKGNNHKLYINGIKTVDYTEKDSSIPAKGIFAIQLHDGGVAKVEFRNLVIEEL